MLLLDEAGHLRNTMGNTLYRLELYLSILKLTLGKNGDPAESLDHLHRTAEQLKGELRDQAVRLGRLEGHARAVAARVRQLIGTPQWMEETARMTAADAPIGTSAQDLGHPVLDTVLAALPDLCLRYGEEAPAAAAAALRAAATGLSSTGLPTDPLSLPGRIQQHATPDLTEKNAAQLRDFLLLLATRFS